MTTQNPQQSSAETVSAEQRKSDLAKRVSVFAKSQDVVLVNFFAINDRVKELLADPTSGITLRPRDEQAIQAKHAAEAEERGQIRKVIRSHEDDTGFPVLTTKDEKDAKPGVWINHILADLAIRSLKYNGGHVQHVMKPKLEDGKKVLDESGEPILISKGFKLVLNFSIDGVEVRMPEVVRELFTLRFNDCTVWANLKFAKDGSKRQKRLDTLTVAGDTTPNPLKTEQSTPRFLAMKGNTYRLVQA